MEKNYKYLQTNEDPNALNRNENFLNYHNYILHTMNQNKTD